MQENAQARQTAQGERGREAQQDRESALRTERESLGTERESGRQSQGTGVARRGGPVQSYGGAGALANPFALMQRMAEDMDRLFEQFGFGRMGVGLSPNLGAMIGPGAFGAGSRLGRADQALWSPQVEVFRRGDELVVRADLPGIEKENLDIEVENDVLTIRGERREEHEEEREGVYRSERSYGRFHRAIPLPEGTDAERCEASYQDGVLEITLPAPKEEARSARRIQIR